MKTKLTFADDDIVIALRNIKEDGWTWVSKGCLGKVIFSGSPFEASVDFGENGKISCESKDLGLVLNEELVLK